MIPEEPNKAVDPKELKPEYTHWKLWVDSLNRYPAYQETLVKPVRIDVGRRFVSLMIDFFVGYLISVIVSFIPFVSVFSQLQLTMMLYLMVRDFLFAGRGIGKNLMGLQVVDIMTGEPASLRQSLKRNIVIFGPALIFYLVTGVLHLIPIPLFSGFLINFITLLGTVYTLGVIPYEAYRVYTRVDGLRLGDQWAGTALIEAPMDFRKFLPKQNSH